MAITIEISVQIHVICVWNQYVWETIAHIYDEYNLIMRTTGNLYFIWLKVASQDKFDYNNIIISGNLNDM